MDFIRSMASGFILLMSLPPAIATAARSSVECLRTDQTIRARFWNRVETLKAELAKTDLPVIQNDSHIVPIVVGEAALCKEICDRLLLEHQIYVQPINYPTVLAWGRALDVSPSPLRIRMSILCNLWKRFKRLVVVVFEKLLRK